MLRENKEKFGLRKLSVGLASVMLGVTTMNIAGHTVHADSIDGNSQSVEQNSGKEETANDSVKPAQVVKEVKTQTENKAVVKTADTTVRGGKLI